MATYNDKIVVWERSNKHGKWCPYSADICTFLEENLKKNVPTVCLGDVHQDLKIYSVNLKDLLQVSEATGTKLPVRRRLCDSLGVLGRGFSWQWHDDHDTWNTYDADVNDFIDLAYLENKKSVSLNRKFPDYPYEIIFSKMLQINKRSKRKRKVQRSDNSSRYPIASSTQDPVDDEKVNVTTADKVQAILSPEYLSQEVHKTSDLLNQVNAYRRNVQSPDCADHTLSNGMEVTENNDCSEEEVVRSSSSQSNQSSSVPLTTVALVGGKPWTDSWPPHTHPSKLKPVPGIEPLPMSEKPKRTKKRRKDTVKTSPDEVINVFEKYTEVIDLPSDANSEVCIICREALSSCSSYNDDTTVSKLTLCSHSFHKACIEAMFNSGSKEFLQCPSCKTIHGEKCGIQPPGEMTYHVLPYSLPGYPKNDTIRIIYNIYSGIQGPEHPRPGRPYSARGFPRHCYLPDNEMGRKILRLLVKAWKRRLIFTIGQSSTTGEENTVTWNEIHHKTEFGCNKRGHGYPDPNYFNNVLAELEAHGVVDEAPVWYPA